MKILDPRITEAFGEPVRHTQNSNEYGFNCPYCIDRKGTPDIHGHLYVDVKNLVYFCFRCGAKGYLSEKEYIKPSPTDDELIESFKDIFKDQSKYKYKVSLNQKIPMLKPYVGSEGYKYLINRGITQELIDFYNIREGTSGFFKDRIIIPNKVYDDYDKFESWTDMMVARYIKKSPKDENGKDIIPKYLNQRGSNRRKTVFNLFRIPMYSDIIITEGCFSAISAGSNAVATYGKYVTDIQLRKILNKQPKRIYVSLDPDADKDAIELCNRILKFGNFKVYKVDMPKGEDPNSLGHEKYMYYLYKAIPYNNKINFLLYSINKNDKKLL